MRDEYLETIINCPLFNGIGKKNLEEAVSLLKGRIKEFPKGHTFTHYEDRISAAGIVLSGCVEGTFLNEGFDEVSMNRFSKGMMFGEALACIEKNRSPMEIKAVEDTVVLFVALKEIYCNPANSPLQFVLAKNLIESLAEKNQFLNMKVRLFSQKSLRDRILMYLSTLPKNKDGYSVLPFNKTELASFLCVNRSALSRELGRLQDEKLILISGRNIKITV